MVGLIDDYFAAVTAEDPELLRRVFVPDATFDVDGDRRRGHEDILAYYTEHTFVFEDFRPDPAPLQIDGSTVTVDIDVHLGGTERTVRDVFETDGERITALRVRGFADVLGPRARADAADGWTQAAGCGRGPRRSRPGSSPVATSCSRTTAPDFTVAV